MLQTHPWQPLPDATRLVLGSVDEFCRRCPAAERLGNELREKTGTRLFDWIDHLACPFDLDRDEKLRQLGFVAESGECSVVWSHPWALLPTIVVHREPIWRAAVKVDSVADFLAAHRLTDNVTIEGDEHAQLRRAKVASHTDFEGSLAELWIVECHGCRGWEVPKTSEAQSDAVPYHLDAFRHRQRLTDPLAGFDHAAKLIKSAINSLGADWACDLFFQAEREYWTKSNRAAQWQLARQQSLGMGWGNHDHHTYRSSREHFANLVAVLEKLGLECRESFYAGREAGWGAQILEQPQASIVVFADVDMTADEVVGDFAHQGLAPSATLGTVGLWCKLHGEAFLAAGMHHLECRFDFDVVRQQLQASGIPVMKPFTDLPYLKQAFTEGVIWTVFGERIDATLAAGQITAEQAERFRHNGALGSHLEILQRDDGYKGFNQAGISDIIHRTDPRLASGKS